MILLDLFTLRVVRFLALENFETYRRTVRAFEANLP